MIEGRRILIVDDNLTNLRVLSASIKSHGWTILVATDGESAIEQAMYAEPDLILLDVMMPGIDGFDTCKLLKKNEKLREIPVIFMTALSDIVDKVKGLELGAVDYITKPFQTEEVIARLRVHLKLRSLTQNLEELVEERTAKLTQAMQELQQSQLQLVQSEKMSSLGQLVAGVAHEINNPVGFIDGNLSYVEEYIEELIKHLELYQKKFPTPGEEIEKHASQIDLEYLIEDLPKTIGSMKVGTERIRNISATLRTFSRIDAPEKVYYNLHEGLETTLMILKHRLKATSDRGEIKVIKNYGNLPEVKCYPSQINQVFMNLIANAIDALELNAIAPEPPPKNYPDMTIKIITKTSDNFAIVRIQDNGAGIPEEVRQRVFEYLFTTKPAGKGTGLGLSISHHIVVDNHQGRIECLSAPGAGAEFIVEIPINPI